MTKKLNTGDEIMTVEIVACKTSPYWKETTLEILLLSNLRYLKSEYA